MKKDTCISFKSLSSANDSFKQTNIKGAVLLIIISLSRLHVQRFPEFHNVSLSLPGNSITVTLGYQPWRLVICSRFYISKAQVQEFIIEPKQYIFNAHSTWAVANVQYTFYNIYIVRLERNIRKHSLHSQKNNINIFEQLNIYF